MKSLTFAEFFTMPPGTIFGQVTGLPHQFSCGLFKTVTAFPAIHGRDGDEAEPATVSAIELTPFEDGEVGVKWFISDGELEEDHRFLVYEDDDLDRLAGLIGRGPGWVAQPVTSAKTPPDPHPKYIQEVWQMDSEPYLWTYEFQRANLFGKIHGGIARTEQEARQAMASEIAWLEGPEERDSTPPASTVHPDIIPPEHQGRWIAWTSDGLHVLGSGDSVAAARKAAGAYPDPLIAWSPRAGELRAVPKRGNE
jgi:hypothetical protein